LVLKINFARFYFVDCLKRDFVIFPKGSLSDDPDLSLCHFEPDLSGEKSYPQAKIPHYIRNDKKSYCHFERSEKFYQVPTGFLLACPFGAALVEMTKHNSYFGNEK
jgi:hypothetical protein